MSMGFDIDKKWVNWIKIYGKDLKIENEIKINEDK